MEHAVHELLKYAYHHCNTLELRVNDSRFAQLINAEKRATRWSGTMPPEYDSQTTYFVPQDPKCFVRVLESRLVRPLTLPPPPNGDGKSSLLRDVTDLSKLECAYMINLRTKLLELAFPVANRLAVSINDNFIGKIPVVFQPGQPAHDPRVTMVCFVGAGTFLLTVGLTL